MPIDHRSPIGEQLQVKDPLEIDLRQLDMAAGELIARTMADKDLSRDEAIINVLGRAAKLMNEKVVHLDIEAIFTSHPEVLEQVVAARGLEESATGGRFRVARFLTVLMVRGARVSEKPTPDDSPKRSDALGGLGDLFGATENLLDVLLRKTPKK